MRKLPLLAALVLAIAAAATSVLADGNVLHKYGRTDPIDMRSAKVYDTKGPLQIGSTGTSAHSLASGDVLDGNNLEVLGVLYNSSGAVKNARVASVVINANTTTLQPLWTCPANKTCYVDSVFLKAASGTSSTASCGVGWDAGGSNVVSATTHAITATTYMKLAPAAVATFNASGGSLGFKCGTAEGAALTFTVDIYGFAE